MDENNESTLYIRLTPNRQNHNIRLKRKIAVNKWDSKRKPKRGGNQSSNAFNSNLDGIKTDLFQICRDLSRKGLKVSAKSIKSYYLGEAKETYSLIDIFRYHIITFAINCLQKFSVITEL